MKVKKLNKNAIIPTRGSDYAAGWDLYACVEDTITVAPHETQKIGTGIAVAIPNAFFGAVCARSGLATKEGLRPANCVGIVDADYRGEIIVALHNDSNYARYVSSGERIGQLVIIPYCSLNPEEVDELDETERGAGGFGSTGA